MANIYKYRKQVEDDKMSFRLYFIFHSLGVLASDYSEL